MDYIVHEVAKGQTGLSNIHFHFHFQGEKISYSSLSKKKERKEKEKHKAEPTINSMQIKMIHSKIF